MCGHRRQDWASRERSARRAPDVRAAQADRDRTVEDLRDHAADGRLDVSELERRTEAALEATTYGDLQVLLADLPAPRRREPRPRSLAFGLTPSLALLLAGIAVLVLAPAAVCWTGWLLVGLWFVGGGRRPLRRASGAH